MARSFNGTSDNISTGLLSSIFGLNKITIGFWLNWTTFANNDKLACEYSANYGANTGSFICDPNSGNPNGIFYFGCASGLGAVTTAEFTRPSAGVWHQYVCHIDGTATGANCIPAIYLDGISQSLTHTNTGSGTFTFGHFSLYLMCRAAASLFGAGSMADFAIWGGVLLTVGEALALASGVQPYMIRPASLSLYLPIDGLQSPEPDLSGNVSNGTLAGTAFAPGPPMTTFTPKWRQLVLPSTAPAVTSVFRKSASRIGTRTGTRQTWAA